MFVTLEQPNERKVKRNQKSNPMKIILAVTRKFFLSGCLPAFGILGRYTGTPEILAIVCRVLSRFPRHLDIN